MVLRDSDSSRCDCLAGVEEAEPGVAGRVCIPYPFRDRVDKKTVYRRTHKARTLLVVEAMVSPEESDTNQCGDVRADRSLGRMALEMERASRSSWLKPAG